MLPWIGTEGMLHDHYLSAYMFQIIISSSAIFIAFAYSLYFSSRRAKSLPDWMLPAALSVTALLELFDLLSIIHPERMLYWKKMEMLAEGSLPFFWLLFTLTYARHNGLRSLTVVLRLLLALSLFLMAVPVFIQSGSLFYSPDFSVERVLFLGDGGFYFYLALLVYLIIALIHLEITYTSASRGARWNMKFELLGVGALLAALIYYYSQGLLYRTINMDLIPLRSVSLMMAVLLIAYSQMRQRDWSKIYVSRNMAYKSVVLFAVGIYLVGLGLMGEGMRHFGESFHRSLIIATAFVSGVAFLSIFLSETVKRKIKIFLDNNFYRNKYDYRTQWLLFIDRLSSARTLNELLASILSGYCETFGMGCGAVFFSIKERDGFSPVAQLQMEPITLCVNRNEPFIRYMFESKSVVNLSETIPDRSGEISDFLKIYEMLFVIPLFINESIDGFILLGRPLNRSELFDIEDYELMTTFAHQTSSAILNLRLADQLAQAREMEALGKISAFVVHDLKNLVYTVSLILDNARDYITEPEFQRDMLSSLDNTVAKMKTLISKLKYQPEKRGLQKEPTDLLHLIQETASSIAGAGVCVKGSATIADVDKIEIQKVALNLLLNAIDATNGEGPVMVEVGCENQAFIRVKDEGCGIPEDFLHRHLFSPFKSTKQSGLGIGLYQCKQIVEAHNGKIEATSVVGRGSIFTVWLPAMPEPSMT